MSLPSGTITFLFTDIEGSTRQWEKYPEAMKQAQMRHQQIISDSVHLHGGNLVLSRGEGDSTFSVFPYALDAVIAATCLQRTLHTEKWPNEVRIRVRAAIHTGAATAHQDNYNASDVNRCARIRAIGHGGQTLLSQATFALVQDMLPEELSLKDMGQHRLKDLQRPEQIYQLMHPALPIDFPPLTSLNTLSTNLPLQLTSFIGREREIATIKALLSRTRLLTLTGSGGCGKTRLCLQAAADIVPEYPDGAWFVELATLTDPSLVPKAVASVLELREGPGYSLLQLLLEYLKNKKLLLILDNCEHLIMACAQFADTLLKACPALKIFSTSREELHIPGETCWRVTSLSLPKIENSSLLTEEDKLQVREAEATQLFMERALAICPTFAPDDKNTFTIAQICRRLDGIPLAIELAAARVNMMSVEQIAARLDDRFLLLTGGSRTGLPRHQTLRALIDWSYDLLSEKERILLRRLAVFHGGSMESIEAVCTGDGLQKREILDLLGQLVAKSLVIFDESHRVIRYRLLETVREYCWEKLVEANEKEVLCSRHCAYLTGLAELSEPELVYGDQDLWLEKLDRENDDFRAVLDRCQVNNDRVIGLQLAAALWRYWFFRGHLQEGSEWLVWALQHDPDFIPSALRAKASVGLGILHFFQGNLPDAQAAFESGLAEARRLEDAWLISLSLNTTGVLACYAEDMEQAARLYNESLQIARQAEDSWMCAISLSHLGFIALFRGDLDCAQELCEESLLCSRNVGEKWCIGNSLYYLGTVMLARGDYQRARHHLLENLAVSRELGQPVIVAWSLEQLAFACKQGGEMERAGWLLGAAESFRKVLNVATAPAMRAVYDQNIESLRTALGEERFNRVWAEGGAMTRDAVIAYALEPSTPRRKSAQVYTASTFP